RGEETCRLVVGKWTQRQRRRVRLASSPVRAPLEELRPCRADDEKRHVRSPVDEKVDETEQLVVGPVKIFEHDHKWTLLRKRLERSEEHTSELQSLRHLVCRL